MQRTGQAVTVQTSGVELAEGLLMTAGLSVNSRYEPKNSRRSDTQIPSSLNSYARRSHAKRRAALRTSPDIPP